MHSTMHLDTATGQCVIYITLHTSYGTPHTALYSKALKDLRYKKVFLHENLKTRCSDMKKIQKATKL